MYTENKYTLNPAYAGLFERPDFFLSYRKIASDIDGTPQSLSFGGSAMIYRNMSLGGRIYRQSEGLFNTTIGFVDYSYLLKLSASQNLRFGISAGLNFNKMDRSNIIADDPSAIINVASNNFEGTYFESSAGIAYQWKNLEIGLAVPKLFSSRNNFGLSVNSFVQYTYRITSKEIDLKPSFFMNYSAPNPYLYDINLQVYWKNKMWIGLGYRNRPSIIISAGFRFENIGIAYSSELGMEKYANMFNHIHQVTVYYSIHKKQSTPVDTLIIPVKTEVAKIDSVNKDSSLIEPAIVEENTDSVDIGTNHPDEDLDSKYDIVEIGEGVYVVKTNTADSVLHESNNDFQEQEMISEQDSVLALNLVNQIEKDEKEPDFEMVEVGDGVYTFKHAVSDSLNPNQDIDEEMLDSLINESDLFEKALKDQAAAENNGAYYHSEYYTVQLLINESNKHLLTNAAIVDMARIEKNQDGKIKYYYGYFSSKQEAERHQKRFSKFDLNTKVLKFNAFQ